ncbi:hypothetical protein SLS53_009382 [Cytospora paraplurivora]|uniref:SANT domain-containing protein n=1 Tax=Cytospora paraplurivora TaxID=2898453 RepID=A0AAN9YAZ6_9PEZI
MSSMLKKGAGAFKPRAPIARRRPVPPAVTPAATAPHDTDEATTPTESQRTTTPAQEPNTEAPPDSVASTTAEPQSVRPSPAISTDVTAVPSVPSQGEVTNTTATQKPVVTKPTKAVTSASNNAQPGASHVSPSGASAEPVTITKPASRLPEKQSAPVQDTVDVTAPTSATGTTAKEKATPSSRSTAFTKPQPIAETTAPKPPSVRPPETVSVPSTEEVASQSPDTAEGSSAPAASKAVAPKKPRKPAAPRQPRKRKPAATTGESEAEPGAETDGPPKKKRAAPRKKKAAPTTNGEDGGGQVSGLENGEDSAAPKRKAPRKKKAAATADQATTDAENDGARAGDRTGDEEDGGGDEEAEKAAKQARRKRSVTPDDAEQQTVDHEQMVMGDLTKDLRIGSKFSKYDELRERIRKKRARQRLVKLGKLQPGEDLPEGEDGASSEAGTPAPDSSSSPPLSSKPAAPKKPVPVVIEAPADAGMPRLVMRDGQLTLDEGTMQYDRHAAADAARGVVYEQEEDEFTTAVTQATYMRRQPQGNFWTDEETVKFYHGLRMFGTDFNTIAKMFGGAKNRRQVKLKFNREERANPAAVNRCIIGEKVVPMALDAVGGAGGLEDSKAITDELDRLKEEQEAETRRQEEDKAAENQRRRDELFGRRKGDKASHHDDGDGDGGGDGFRGDLDGAEDHNGAAVKANAALGPAAMYGVGTDPDVIDETDLPSASARGKGRGARGGRGRRGGRAMFAGGIGA